MARNRKRDGVRMEKERRRTGLVAPSRSYRSSPFKTFSWSGAAGVATAIFEQTLTSAFADTKRPGLCPWLAKAVAGFLHPYVYFGCAYPCLFLRTAFQYRVVQPCCATHTFLMAFSALQLNTPFFFFFWAETLHFISLILPHRHRETRYSSVSNYKRLQSQVKREK